MQALILNCRLKRSAAPSNTEWLARVVSEAPEAAGAPMPAPVS